MSKKTERPATARHILIYDSDWEFLERYFGAGTPRSRRVGCSYMCREYIHNEVNRLKKRMTESMDILEEEEDLEDAE